MANEEKKGITVKIDAALHAEVRQYLETHGMTMAEFITLAIDDELHPKIVEQEEKTMEKMRTLAFQVNEELFQKVKDYLRRNNMSQKEFVIGLIEAEIDRDLAEREALRLEREAVDARVAETAELEEDTTAEEAEEVVEQPECSDEMAEESAEEHDFAESESAEAEEESVDEVISSEEEMDSAYECELDDECEEDDFLDTEDEESEEAEEVEMALGM